MMTARKISKAEARETAQCPNCGDTADNLKELSEKFGFRDVGSIRGAVRTTKLVPQSRCYACRSNKKIDGVPVAELRRQAPKPPAAVTAAANALAQSAVARMEQRVANILSPIPTAREPLKALYCMHYPNDKANQKRSVNFMKAKLAKKIGGK